MNEKTHYRKVMKSDHLGVADLEEFIEEKRPLVFTIKHVKQEFNVSVAGRKGNFNIAYFEEPIKPLVLNSTNGKTVSSFNNNSPWIEDWAGTEVELYIDPNVTLMKETTGGIRIRKAKPKVKTKPLFTEANFESAKKAKATIEQVKAVYTLTDEIQKKYESYIKG